MRLLSKGGSTVPLRRWMGDFFRYRFYLPLSLSFFLPGCSTTPDYQALFKENNGQFNQRRNSFVKLERTINGKYLSVWKKQDNVILQAQNAPEDIRSLLESLGVGTLSFSTQVEEGCDGEYTLRLDIKDDGNLDELRVVTIFYDPCDDNTEKGKHYYDGYHIDIWGQGDGWGIFSDIDFI